MPIAGRASVGGANPIPASEVTTSTVNGKRGHRRNASSDNERNAFAGSRSGLNDESGSNGKELRENAGSKRSQSEQRGIPVRE